VSLATLALRGMVRRKVRAATTILVTALVVALIAGFSAAAFSGEIAVDRYMSERLGDADLLVSNATGYLSGSLLGSLSSIEGVEKVEGILSLYGDAVKGDSSFPAEFYGLDPAGELRGNWLGEVSAGLEENMTLVSDVIADQLEVDEGDEFTVILMLMNNNSTSHGSGSGSGYCYTVFNVTVDRVVSRARRWVWETAEPAVYVNIAWLWKVINRTEVYSTLYVTLRPGADPEDVSLTVKSLSPDIVVRSVSAWSGFNMVKEYYGDLLGYIIFAGFLFVCLFSFLNLQDSRREIGVLKTMGASSLGAAGAFLLETAICGAAGLLLGLALSLVAAVTFLSLFKGIMMLTCDIPLVLNLDVYLLGAAVGFILPLISAVFTVLVVARMDPVKILQRRARVEEVKVEKSLVVMGVIFLVMGVVSLFFPGFMSWAFWARLTGLLYLLPLALLVPLGRPFTRAAERLAGVRGMLSVIFTRRRLTASVYIILLIGTSCSFFVTTNATSDGFNLLIHDVALNRMRYDLTLSLSVPQGWNEASTILSSVEGVEDYLLTGMVVTRAGNDTVFLLFVDNLSHFLDFLAFPVEAGSPDLLGNDSAMVFKAISYMSFEWARPPLLHREVNLTTYTGYANVTVDLVFAKLMPELWVFLGFVPISSCLVVERAFIEQHFPLEAEMAYAAAVRCNQNPDLVASRLIEEFTAASAYTTASWLKSSTDITACYSAFFYIIGYSLLLVGVLVLFIVQLRNVSSWRRELGILKAQGLSDGQILSAFILQSLLLSLLAIATVTIDYPLSISQFISMMADYGLTLPVFLNYASLLPLTALVTAVSAAAAIPPAVKVFRLQPAEAIKAE